MILKPKLYSALALIVSGLALQAHAGVVATDGDVPSTLNQEGTESDPSVYIIGNSGAYTRDYGDSPLYVGYDGDSGRSSWVHLYIQNGSTVLSGDDSCVGVYYDAHDRIVRLTEASNWTINGQLSCPSSGWNSYLEILDGSLVECGLFTLAGGSYSSGTLTVSNANSRMLISGGVNGGTATGASSQMFIHDSALVRVDTNAYTYVDHTYIDGGFFAWKGDHVSEGLTDPFYGIHGWNGSGWQDIYAFDQVGDWKCTDWPPTEGEPFYLVAYCETDAEAKTFTADPQSGFEGYDGLGGYTIYTSYLPEGSNTLTVVSAHGSPTPAVGANQVANELPLNCSVEAVTIGTTNWVPTGWTLEGQEPTSGTTNTFDMLSRSDATLTWNWQTNYWLEINIEGAGSLNLDDGFYAEGSEQSLVATSQKGWVFTGWSGDITGTETSASITMNAPHTLTAHFENTLASTNTFGSGDNEFSIEFTAINDSGNEADETTGFGAVGYDYRIGTFEITYTQWTNFTALAGEPIGSPSSAYNSGPSWTDSFDPATGISWYEAAQFCNWLTSGSPTNGAYIFAGLDWSTELVGVDRAAALSAYDTVYVLPTRDEWYKAAYYTGASYSDYANGTDVRPIEGVEANYYDGYYDLTGESVWSVGYGSLWEQNSTKDMNGNVREWTESAYDGVLDDPTENRRVFDGYHHSSYSDLMRTSTLSVGPAYEVSYYGFRVASIDSGYLGDFLTVNSAHGTPTPSVGTHTNAADAVITCSVENEIDGETQYVVTGWIGTGSVPASGTSNSVEITMSENSSITWLWQTNVWLETETTGQGQVTGGDVWAVQGSQVGLAAVPDAGWLFMGWSGDAVGTNNVTLTMDAPKSVTAVFSDDADGDGLTNTEEAAAGSDPWLTDTDGDGFSDKLEVDNGGSPIISDQWRVDYIRDNAAAFDLSTSNSVIDIAVGQMLLETVDGVATMTLQLEQSEDLSTWTNAGEAVIWEIPSDGPTQYFRVRSEK